MRVRAGVALVGVVLLGVAIAHVLTADPIPEVRAPAPVLFVCRNGVAMSVWSAAYFNRLAAARDLPEWAVARASLPSFSDVPLNMAFALALDGFRLAGYRPEVVSAEDVRNARIVVAIDTELPPDARPGGSATEVWDGFPPMREEYYPSRSALKTKVEALVERLARAQARDRGTATVGASESARGVAVTAPAPPGAAGSASRAAPRAAATATRGQGAPPAPSGAR